MMNSNSITDAIVAMIIIVVVLTELLESDLEAAEMKQLKYDKQNWRGSRALVLEHAMINK